MKILVVSDSSLDGVEFPRADLLVSLGDLPSAYLTHVKSRVLPCPAFAVPGNHDPEHYAPSGWMDIHAKTTSLAGYRCAGFGGCYPYKSGPWFFYEENVAQFVDRLPPIDVMLTHNSPAGIHDSPDDEPHLGYEAFARRIQTFPPKLWLHGHQHKNVTSEVNGCTIIGVFGAAVVDWDHLGARVTWQKEPF